MTNLVLLDFDRTLFRSDDHSEALLEVVISHNLIESDHAEELRSEMFSSENTVDTSAILRRRGINPDVVFEYVRKLNDTFMYGDAQEFLDGLSDFHVVTTATDVVEQQAKLKLAGLHDKATILPGAKKGEYLVKTLAREGDKLVFPDHHPSQQYDSVVLIDDRYDAIEAVVGTPGVRTILIQRDDAKYEYGGSHPSIEVVKTLKEISL